MSKRPAWPLVAAAIVLTVAAPARVGAADKAHQQMMAEIRMLQEQQQQVQQMLASLGDALKSMGAKIDEQTGAPRKAFADQKLLVDNVADGVRVLREKADDTNVRLSSMTQELEALRQTIASMPAPVSQTTAGEPPAGETGLPVGAPPTPPVATPMGPQGVSPQKMFDNAFSDYTGGQFDLAINGFETYIRMFPRLDKADDAQLRIGDSLYQSGKNREAVDAYQKVMSDYPQSDSVPAAYYKLGLTYEGLKQVELAKKAFETVMQKYPTAREAVLAQQRLNVLNRR